MLLLCQQERQGQYPGGEHSRPRRLKFICELASDSSLSCITHGVFAGSYTVYRNIWWWQLQRRKLDYVLGFHYTACMSLLRKALGRI